MGSRTKLRLGVLAAPVAAALAAGAFAAGGGSEAPRLEPVVAPPSSIVDSPRPQAVEETSPVARSRRRVPPVGHEKRLPDPFEEGRF